MNGERVPREPIRAWLAERQERFEIEDSPEALEAATDRVINAIKREAGEPEVHEIEFPVETVADADAAVHLLEEMANAFKRHRPEFGARFASKENELMATKAALGAARIGNVRLIIEIDKGGRP